MDTAEFEVLRNELVDCTQAMYEPYLGKLRAAIKLYYLVQALGLDQGPFDTAKMTDNLPELETSLLLVDSGLAKMRSASSKAAVEMALKDTTRALEFLRSGHEA
ncbi:MAG: hypothetical protein Q8R28_15290 [Dehalococcoidia bacterium]|nr:hypothetical protein [Dehalococcoidia bacterium]